MGLIKVHLKSVFSYCIRLFILNREIFSCAQRCHHASHKSNRLHTPTARWHSAINVCQGCVALQCSWLQSRQIYLYSPTKMFLQEYLCGPHICPYSLYLNEKIMPIATYWGPKISIDVVTKQTTAGVKLDCNSYLRLLAAQVCAGENL